MKGPTHQNHCLLISEKTETVWFLIINSCSQQLMGFSGWDPVLGCRHLQPGSKYQPLISARSQAAATVRANWSALSTWSGGPDMGSVLGRSE